MAKRVWMIGAALLLLTLAGCRTDPQTFDTEQTDKPTEAREWVVKWSGEPAQDFLDTVEVLRENEEDHTMLVRVNPDIDQEKWRAEWLLHDNIEYIQPNFRYKLNVAKPGQREGGSGPFERERLPLDYFLDRTEASRAWEAWEPKREVTIAVIDTGVDPEHPLIAPHLVRQTNMIAPGAGAEDITVEDVRKDEEQGKSDAEIAEMYADDPEAYDDYFFGRLGAVGHGTSVIGVLLQMLQLIDGDEAVPPSATSAKVMPIKVMGYENGEKVGGSDFDMTEAIRMAVGRGADIISLSLGDWAYSKNARDAVALAEDAGVLVVAAAGNKQGVTNTPIYYPAAFPTVLAVGGVTMTDEYDEYSNYGPGLDLVAPDENIWTTTVGGEFRMVDGNSFAVPQVTAAAAMVMQQHPFMSPAQVRQLLRQTADALQDEWNVQTGYGRVNAFRAVSEPLKPHIYGENDEAHKAVPVSVDSRIEAALQTEEDENWYVLDFPRADGELTYHVRVRVTLPRRLEEGAELLVKRPGEAEPVAYTIRQTEDVHLTVPPGEVTMGVRFREGEASGYLSYALETELMMAPDPYEDNDHQWHAYELELPLEQGVTGTFHTDGDRDWYRMTTPESGTLTVELAADSPRMDPVLFVQQLGGSGVLVDEYGPMGSESLQIRVEADSTYYVRVSDENINATIGTYHLWIDYEPDRHAVHEPNNRSDRAVRLQQGVPAAAELYEPGDVGWYRFAVDEEADVSLYVAEMEGPIEAEVTLYDRQLRGISQHVLQPGETELSWEETLSQGEYFVRIKNLSGEGASPYVIGYLLPGQQAPGVELFQE